MLLVKPGFIQNCWIVPNIDEAMARWNRMGVGPFFRRDSDYPDAIYRGTPVPLAFKGAIAQAGSVQIELLEQTSEGPSAYRDVVPKGATGFHHMLSITENFESEVEALRASGIAMANEFNSLGGTPVVYADTRDQMGCMLEMLPPSPVIVQIFAKVAEAATDWDGSNPVRPLETLVAA